MTTTRRTLKKYVNVPPYPVSFVGFCSAPKASLQITNLLPHWKGIGNIGMGHHATLLKNNLQERDSFKADSHLFS